MTHKKHPKAKLTLRRVILHPLYHPWYKRLEALYSDLTRENSRLHGNTQLCVRYRGETYGTESYHVKNIPKPINPVHREMREKFRQWHQELQECKREHSVAEGLIANMVTQLHFIEDFYEVLPEMLHKSIPQFSEYFPSRGDVVSSPAVQAFCTKNAPYIKVLRNRATRNLLENS